MSSLCSGKETKFSANFLIIIPIKTGIVTTRAIFKAIPVIVISEDIFVIPSKPAEVKIMKGTEIILTKLITAVSEIERATSPLANLVKTFEVTPPGAAAIIITPKANSTEVLKIRINIFN